MKSTLLLWACLLQVSFAFSPLAAETRPALALTRRPHRTLLQAKPADKDEATKKGVNTEELDPLTKTSWYAVEAFGKMFGSKKEATPTTGSISTDAPPTSLDETLQRIQVDNEREYFLSGQVDKLIYDENCVFADPFVSFEGRDRFVDNLQNLGSLISEYSARPLDYTVGDNAVDTKFMVKLQLKLPWAPVLAWPWGVRCEIDPDTNLIVLHKESWDIDAWEVRCRRPTRN